MVRLVYNTLFLIFFSLTWPYFLWRMKRRGNFLPFFHERFGRYTPEVETKIQNMQNPLWIHAVSVGEMMIAKVLVKEIRKIHPQQAIVITVTTQTGRQVGKPLVDDQTEVLYTPIDFFPITQRAFNLISPKTLVLVENEIWPNMVWEAGKRKIPICTVNARLSPRSWKRYRLFRNFVKPVLKKISWIGIQHEEDRERFAQAGFQPHKLFTIGSLKFDVAELSSHNANLAESIRKVLGWKENDSILFAGSTHPGEEKLIVNIYNKLKKDNASLKLVLAPRHVERSNDVLEECNGLNIVRRSQIGESVPEQPEALLLDTTGELRSLYSMGTIIFMGKSLLGKGGQNFVEAARFGRPIVVGPHMQNFSILTSIFKKDNGLLQVEDEEELEKKLKQLLKNNSQRSELGKNAADIFQKNLGAGRASAKMILDTIRSSLIS